MRQPTLYTEVAGAATKPGAIVLLVDDDPAILDGMADLLSLAGYSVMTAVDGERALNLMQTHLPDLIVSDIMMPKMDGYEFYEAVRTNPTWTTIPFIFLTARGQPGDIRHGRQLGADEYITKPFEPEDLVIAINARLQRTSDIVHATQYEVERMKQQLITIFSHELRTPLTYIYGYVTLLQDSFNALDEQTVNDMLSGVKRGADRLVKLVEDLMLMVRIDSGVVGVEIALRQEPTNLHTLTGNVVARYEEAARERNVQIVSRVPADLVVSCMSVYAEEAISRLIDNAIKFCKREGGQVTVDAWVENGRVSVAVQDNGIGIEPAHQRVIFERFQQIDREVMEQQGIGLGLTIVRELVQLHGGDVQVESQPGEGSTFVVTLPA
jgi:signal transduction histidine kinase